MLINPLLYDILSLKRAGGSRTERKFVRRVIDRIPGITTDSYGNRFLLSPSSQVIISVHTDTVHWRGGNQSLYTSPDGIVELAFGSGDPWHNCLGADDGAGLYAALRMIEAGIDVNYFFHRNEESGGIGSSHVAKHYPSWLAGFTHCIALDRRGSSDIITFQRGSRCASDRFASEFAEMLDLGHTSASGTFTDSANYMEIIPECSNISVGYQHEHTENETLDTVYLESLIDSLCSIDWADLPVYRDPSIDEPEPLIRRWDSATLARFAEIESSHYNPWDWHEGRIN